MLWNWTNIMINFNLFITKSKQNDSYKKGDFNSFHSQVFSVPNHTDFPLPITGLTIFI